MKAEEFMKALMAFQDAQAVLVEYEETRDPSLLSRVRSVKPRCEAAIDTWLSSLNGMSEDHPLRPVLLKGLSMVYRMLAGAHMYLAEYDDAKSCYESARDIGHEIGEASEIVQPLNNLGLIALEQGNPAEAVDYFRQAIADLDGPAEKEFGPTLRKNLASAEAMRRSL